MLGLQQRFIHAHTLEIAKGKKVELAREFHLFFLVSLVENKVVQPRAFGFFDTKLSFPHLDELASNELTHRENTSYF